ncbi:flagellar motor switch protein FliG [Vampirovibrio sp.]|uniref:flagellar motor switch protein FliG n=1 Tax=Vampirovibrio sp. TaxID=2717857 RepID=UPI003593900B
MSSEALSIRHMTNSQKVAALLIALGPKTASEIMKNIEDEIEVEHIALEIASLQRINPETLNAILAEFYSLFQASGYLASGGVSYARQLLNEAYGENQADKILERLVATLQTNPFDFFNNADPAQLATSFQNENPQLVALVLAYLKPERSAAVLGALSPEMQADVAQRIAEMDRTNPEVLREVERIMENKFSSVVTADFSMAGGVESLAEIINRSDRTTEKAILDSLEMKDPEIAEQVRELMFVFEDIIHLDDRSIQRVLREVDTKDLALSLKGSNTDVQEKIFRNMSERATTMLKDDMDYMGPVRAKDVQEKQTFIVSIIRALEGTGEIVVSRGSEEDDFIE